MGFELTTVMVIGTGGVGSCKSIYHTITNTTAPPCNIPTTNEFLHAFFIMSCCKLSFFIRHSPYTRHSNNIPFRSYVCCMIDLSGTTSWHLSNGLYPTAKKLGHVIFLYTCTPWFPWKSDPRTNKMALSKVKGNIMDLVGKCCIVICHIDDSLRKRLSIRI